MSRGDGGGSMVFTEAEEMRTKMKRVKNEGVARRRSSWEAAVASQWWSLG